VAGKNGEGAVYLLGQDYAGELMRQGHVPEGKEQIGALTCGRRPPIRRSDSEHQALDALITDAPEVRGELIRGVLLAATVEQYRIGWSPARLAIQPIEQARFGVEELSLTRNVSGRARYIVGEQAIRSF